MGFPQIVWKEFKGPQRTARVILKKSDRRRFGVTPRSPMSVYLVLLCGELKIILVCDVFTDFFCNQIGRTEDKMSVDNGLQQQLALPVSKIVGQVPNKVQVVSTTRVCNIPYFQGEDDTQVAKLALMTWNV
jgi:hypothetical protein